jgi:heterotetrameric sarcosine oxidase gamma subunit
MTLRENAIVTDVTITPLPQAPLHALEIWSNPTAVAKRFEASIGFALPAMGKSASSEALRLIHYEPTVWLVEGDISGLTQILGGDGVLTAIGGGIVRIRLSGPAWRTLLMEGGVFDAESPSFAPGCSAATIINHVAIRLHVIDTETCDAYVPLSYSAAMIEFWNEAADTLVV